MRTAEEDAILVRFNLILLSTQGQTEAASGAGGGKGMLPSFLSRISFKLFDRSDAALSLSKLEKARLLYSRFKLQCLASSPDHGSSVGAESIHTGGSSSRRGVLEVNNPLSNEVGNVWTTFFEDAEVRSVIQQDVNRAYPEIDYFRSSLVQQRLTDLLFIYTKIHADRGGYKQGLHELLAPLLLMCDLDSLLPSPSPSTSTTAPTSSSIESSNESLARIILSRDYIEHDTFALFSALMDSAKIYYDSTPSVALAIDRPASTTSLTLNHAAGFNPKSSSPLGHSAAVLVQPIVAIAIRIHDTLLKTVDFELYAVLESLEIEPQLYMIRYLRMLFSREFSFDETISLWTGLFVKDPTLRLAEYVVLAMLLRIREAVIDEPDYSSVLQLLLRYPAPNSTPGDYRVSLLLRQAIYLRDHLCAQAGESVRQENIDVSAEAGDFSEERRAKRRMASKQPLSSAAVPAATPEAIIEASSNRIRVNPSVYSTGYALAGTLNDIVRRGVTHAQQSIESEFPTRAFARDASSELNRLRNQNLAMSKAMDVCVDALQQRWSTDKKDRNVGMEASDDGKGLMALTVLKHIKEVLAAESTSFDRNVMLPLLSPILTNDGPLSAPTSSSGRHSATPDPAPLPISSTKSPAQQNSADEKPILASSMATTTPARLSSSSSLPLLLGERSNVPLAGLTRTVARSRGTPSPRLPSVAFPPPSLSSVSSNIVGSSPLGVVVLVEDTLVLAEDPLGVNG